MVGELGPRGPGESKLPSVVASLGNPGETQARPVRERIGAYRALPAAVVPGNTNREVSMG